jgi:hypothetical protein
MQKEDLDHIFKKQIDEGTDSLYFMLIDGDRNLIQRHPTNKIEELLPMLSAFEYAGAEVMPRFKK